MRNVSRSRRKRKGSALLPGSPAVAAAGSFPSGLQNTFVGMAILIVLSFLLYVPTLPHEFVNWDDDRYIRENSHVQQGLTLESVRWAFTTTYFSNWHPLTWLSFELDYQLFGLRPIGYHLTSIILHALNAALLFYLLQAATRRKILSWLAAALWALHPLAVESVSWASELKNVLSLLLFLLALLAYGRYVVRPSLGRYAVVAVFFALALAAKPMVITLPMVLLVTDFWPLERIADWSPPPTAGQPAQIPVLRAVVEKVPLLLLSAASAAVTIIAQRLGGSLQTFDQYSLGIRTANAIWAYLGYIKQILWPMDLAALYPHPGASLSWGLVSLALILIAAITGVAWRWRKARPYLLAGWLWYLGTLVPMIGIVQVGDQAMADRYTYLPSIGPLVGVVWLGADLADHLRIGPTPRWAVAAMILCALSATTWRQQEFWLDDYHLWSHALAVTGNNYTAERNLGADLISRGDADEAMPHFERAIQFNPRDGAAHVNIGAILLKRGQVEAAIRELTLASQLPADPKQKFTAYEDLAVAFLGRGKAELARDNFRRAWETDPEAFNSLIAGYQQRVQQSPSADVYFWLAMLECQTAHRSDAQASWEKALALKPEYSSMQRLFDIVAGP